MNSDPTTPLAAYIRQIDGDHTLGAAQLAEKITERFGVVELPAPAKPDDDGQAYYDDAELRVDHSGTSGPTIHHYQISRESSALQGRDESRARFKK